MEASGFSYHLLWFVLAVVVLCVWVFFRPLPWLREVIRREVHEEQPDVFDWHALADTTRAQPSEYQYLRGDGLRGYDVGFLYLYGDEGFLISYYSRHKDGARTEEIDILPANGARVVAMFHNGELSNHLYMNGIQTPLTHIEAGALGLLHTTHERMRKRIDF